MKLYEFEKAPSNMTTEELEEHMLLLISEMDAATDELINYRKENVFTSNRSSNTPAAS